MVVDVDVVVVVVVNGDVSGDVVGSAMLVHRRDQAEAMPPRNQVSSAVHVAVAVHDHDHVHDNDNDNAFDRVGHEAWS